MIKVPYSVPPSFKVDTDTYGLWGVAQALGYAKRARQMHVEFTARAARCKAGSMGFMRAQERAEEYWRLEEEWTECARRTADNARKRLDQERLDRRNMQRLEKEYGLVCSPESIQAGLKS